MCTDQLEGNAGGVACSITIGLIWTHMYGCKRIEAVTAAAEATVLGAVCDLQLCVCAFNKQV